MNASKQQQLFFFTLAFIAGVLLLSPASAEEPGDKIINTGCYTVVTNSKFRVNSPFGANGPKAQLMVETAAKKWSELFVEYDYGWGGPTFRPLPADLSNPCENQTSSPEDIVELDPIYCAIKDFSDCSTVPGCDADKRQCPLEVCYGIDSNLNYNTADWPTVPGTNCQVQWQSAAYDIDNHQILVGPIPLGGDVDITGGTMVPGNWHDSYSKAAVFVNQDKNWDFDRYNYSAYASEAVVEEAIREVVTAFENQQYYSSDVAGESRDLFETMLHEFGHVVGLDHVIIDPEEEGYNAQATHHLTVMRPQYYTGPWLHASEIKKASELFPFSSSQELDIAVSLLSSTTDKKNHEHIANTFMLPGDGSPDSGILDVAYTVENLSSSHEAEVRVSYCTSGESETCAPSNEIASETLTLLPGESKPIAKYFNHSITNLPDNIFVIAEVTKIDQAAGAEDASLRWNNGTAWSLSVQTDHGVCGDVNGDDKINIRDITALIFYLYKGGTVPRPLLRADINGDYGINIRDITFMIFYLYKGGPRPEGPGCTPPGLA